MIFRCSDVGSGCRSGNDDLSFPEITKNIGDVFIILLSFYSGAPVDLAYQYTSENLKFGDL